MSEFGSIEKLRREHQFDEFDCGRNELNRFLKRQAWAGQPSNSAQTYVLANDPRMLGYYSLAPGSVARDEAPDRVSCVFRSIVTGHSVRTASGRRLGSRFRGWAPRSSRMRRFAPHKRRKPSAPGRCRCMPKATTRMPSMNTSRSSQVRATYTICHSS